MAYEPVGPGGVSNNYGVRETTPSDKYSPTVRYDEEWTPKDSTIVTAKTDPVTGGISFSDGDKSYSVVLSVEPSGDITGSTDSIAINAAIDAVSIGAGGVVELGSGTFYASGILPKDGLWLRGKGKGATVIKMPDATPYAPETAANVIFAKAPADADLVGFRISDLSIDANRSGQTMSGYTTDNAGNGILIRGNGAYYARDFLIDNVEIYGAVYHGLAIYNLARSYRVQGCTFRDNGFRGFHCHADDGTPSTDFSVIGNTVFGNGMGGSDTPEGAPNLRSGLFVALSSTSRATVSNNTIYNEKGVGLDIAGYVAGNVVPADCSTFAANTVYDCGIGIALSGGVVNVSLAGNIVRDCNATGKAVSATGEGISFRGTVGASGISLVGNVVSGCSHWGLIFNGNASPIWKHMTIANNVLIGNGSVARASSQMRISACEAVSVIGNTCKAKYDAAHAATAGQAALQIETSNNCVFIGNHCDAGENDKPGIYAYPTASKLVIQGNYCLRRYTSTPWAVTGNALVVQATDSMASDNLLASGNQASITGTNVSNFFANVATTGAVAPSGLGSNAPTGVTTPQTWLPVNVGGTVRYIPAF